MRGDRALTRMVSSYQFDSVIDIGSGKGEQAAFLRSHHKHVVTVDLNAEADIQRNFMQLTVSQSFDAVWCCHVLEHQLNVNAFLVKLKDSIKEGGVFAITVPPAKHAIVGGHLTLWNAGLLLYNLIMAGFDCSETEGGEYGYNISVIGRKKSILLPPIRHDTGDIEALAPYFPKGWDVKEGFDGDISCWGGFIA